jgi:hypothetical protein
VSEKREGRHAAGQGTDNFHILLQEWHHKGKGRCRSDPGPPPEYVKSENA